MVEALRVSEAERATVGDVSHGRPEKAMAVCASMSLLRSSGPRQRIAVYTSRALGAETLRVSEAGRATGVDVGQVMRPVARVCN